MGSLAAVIYVRLKFVKFDNYLLGIVLGQDTDPERSRYKVPDQDPD
jgi:hypothetical protein